MPGSSLQLSILGMTNDVFMYLFYDLVAETDKHRGSEDSWAGQDRINQLRLWYQFGFFAEWKKNKASWKEFRVLFSEQVFERQWRSIKRQMLLETNFIFVLTVHKQRQLHVDVVLPCLYMIFFVKGTCFHLFSFHVFFIFSFLHFNALECLPGVQYVLNLTQILLWLCTTCVVVVGFFYFIGFRGCRQLLDLVSWPLWRHSNGELY